MDYKYLSKSSCNGVSGWSISQTSLKENSIGMYKTIRHYFKNRPYDCNDLFTLKLEI